MARGLGPSSPVINSGRGYGNVAGALKINYIVQRRELKASVFE